MATTELTRVIHAPRAAVYRALLDADAVQGWLVPDGMTSEVHAFDPREGGTFRVSLTYTVPGGTAVTGRHENLPPGVRPEDNELGWSMSMGKLATLVEGR